MPLLLPSSCCPVQAFCILRRDNSIVVNLAFIRCVITPHFVLLVPPDDDQSSHFLARLKSRLPTEPNPSLVALLDEGPEDPYSYAWRGTHRSQHAHLSSWKDRVWGGRTQAQGRPQRRRRHQEGEAEAEDREGEKDGEGEQGAGSEAEREGWPLRYGTESGSGEPETAWGMQEGPELGDCDQQSQQHQHQHWRSQQQLFSAGEAASPDATHQVSMSSIASPLQQQPEQQQRQQQQRRQSFNVQHPTTSQVSKVASVPSMTSLQQQQQQKQQQQSFAAQNPTDSQVSKVASVPSMTTLQQQQQQQQQQHRPPSITGMAHTALKVLREASTTSIPSFTQWPNQRPFEPHLPPPPKQEGAQHSHRHRRRHDRQEMPAWHRVEWEGGDLPFELRALEICLDEVRAGCGGEGSGRDEWAMDG